MSTNSMHNPPGDDSSLAEAHLAAIVESSDDAILSKDLNGRILSWNRGAERLYGYSTEEAVGQPIFMIVPTELHDEVRRLLAAVGRGERVEHHDTRRRHRDGTLVEVSLTVSPIRDDQGTITAASVIARDISERRRLEEVGAHLAAIVESSDDAILSKDLNGRILSWNRGAERLYGFTAEEAVGQPISLIVPTELHEQVAEFLAAVGRGERVERHDTWRRRKDGSLVEVSLAISPVRAGQGAITSASVIARDITERKEFQRRLVQLAGEDQLTGIANRRAFLRQLEQHLGQCAQSGWTGALVAIDIDRFKAVNDTLGHAAGDQLIRQTASQLRRRLHQHDLLARIGGDEFALLLPTADRDSTAGVVADLVSELADLAITIAATRCGTGSVGWALIDEPMNADEALVRADLAAYGAKRAGGNQSRGYSAAADTRLVSPNPFNPGLLPDGI
jgi:diguanylate cyclase (GGDEF)-like protein/PAS domain S-box-containing protein